MAKKIKIKEFGYFKLTQEDINETENLFKELLKTDTLQAKILYLNILTSDYIEHSVINGLYSPLEISAALYNLKMYFNNDVFSTSLDFLNFHKQGN